MLKQQLGLEDKEIEATELYRGTRDGFSSENLYSKVQDKGNCLVLIKSKNGHRFGGFRSVAFNKSKNGYISDPKAFLFSLDRLMICKLKES